MATRKISSVTEWYNNGIKEDSSVTECKLSSAQHRSSQETAMADLHGVESCGQPVFN